MIPSKLLLSSVKIVLTISIVSEPLAAQRTEIPFEDYCNFKPGHIGCAKLQHGLCEKLLCKPTPNCGMTYLLKNTDRFRKEILQKHNNIRSTVAKGQIILIDGKEYQQSNAADMKALSYDMELEFSAQCMTGFCEIMGEGFDCFPSLKYDIEVQQNWCGFWVYAITDYDSDEVLNRIMHCWIKQVKNMARDELREGGFAQRTKFWRQLIWAKTKYVGCGRRAIKRNYTHSFLTVYCNYAPGRETYKPVYSLAETCYYCDYEESCKNGLCTRTEKKTASDYKKPFEIFGAHLPGYFDAAKIKPGDDSDYYIKFTLHPNHTKWLDKA